MKITGTKDVAAMQLIACTKVDTAAEIARTAYITKGSGQALEYQSTQNEATAASFLPDPLDPSLYPFLVAELNAQLAMGIAVGLRDIVGQVMAMTAAWNSAGASIKEIRRLAKLQIGNAACQAEIDAIVNALTWPS